LVVLAVVFSWIFIYWLLHAVLRRPIPIRIPLVAALGLILIPTLPKYLAALTSWLQLQMLEFDLSPFVIPSGISYFAWCIILMIMGAWLLWLLLKLMLALGDIPLPGLGKQRAIIAIFLLTALPFNYLNNQQVDAWTLVSFFDDISYSLRYLILFPIYLFLKHIASKDDFDIQPTEIMLTGMLFAFYLCGQSTNLLLVPIPLLLGWYLFKEHLMVTSNNINASMTSPQKRADTVARLLAVKEAQRLQHGYKKQGEKAYTSGELKRDAYEDGMKLAKEHIANAKASLAMTEYKARETIFTLGPEPGRLSNAHSAVFYSIPIILLFQLGTINQTLSGQIARSYPLLDIIIPLLSGTFAWLICAFLFGYLFHLIKGRNGIEKALVFSAVLILPALVIIILNGDSLLGERAGERVLRIVIFVLYLGLFAFDFKTMRSHDRGLKDLIAVYGLGQVIAFASSFLALGSVAVGPLLIEAIKWLSKLAGVGV